MSRGNSRAGNPHVVTDMNGAAMSVEPLERRDLRSAIQEHWLQALIDASPGVLPVASVDERVSSEVFSLGREVGTPSGPIDNLLISRSGHIVLVETKLWRNPEMRRQVVAQVLDYAAHVRTWQYEDLERLWRSRHPSSEGMWRGVGLEEDEASWIDRVSDNLAAGRMTLIVAGDGIDGRAETLAEAVGGHPNFEFRLALVELRLFELADGRTLVVPNTLARTSEIERATVRITFNAGAPRPEVLVQTPAATLVPPSGARSRGTLSAQLLMNELERSPTGGKLAAEVVDELLRQIEAHPEIEVDWKSAGFTLKAADPCSEGDVLSLAGVSKAGMFYAYLPWIHGQIARRWQDAPAAEAITRDLRRTITDFGAATDATGQSVTLSLGKIKGREAALVGALVQFVSRVATAASLRGEASRS